MNFGTLKSRLLAQIGRAPSEICYELVTAEINENVRLSSMLATDTFAPVAEYALPADFLADVSVFYEDGGHRLGLQSMSASAFDSFYSEYAHPAYYSIADGTMRLLGPTGGGTVTLRYYQRQDDLSADTDTNAILTKHPAIYVYGALAHHAALIQNPEALSIHFAAFERAVANAKRADRERKAGGNVSGPRLRTAP